MTDCVENETEHPHSYSTNPAYKGEGSVWLSDNTKLILFHSKFSNKVKNRVYILNK